MPELPEVETVRRGLEPVMVGQIIKTADVNRPDLRWPFPENMAGRLSGKSVNALRRRSKYLLCDLSSGETLIVHLGMSGRMTISGHTIGDFFHPHPQHQKHDHVVFHMQDGTRVTFNDPRRFGAMDLVATDMCDTHPLLGKLGPEPFGNDFNEIYLMQSLKNRKTTIKSALLDQRIIAGLGNIYVCEALYRSGISPKRKVENVSKQKIEKLVPTIKAVLDDAIKAGGSSLRDHRQASGELGYFQHNFQVYDREGDVCKTEDCKGKINRIVQSGRSTFFCSQCQR